MKNIIRIGCAMAASALLAGCGIADGGCSAVDMDILVEPGLLANNVSAQITNGSDKAHTIYISAADPEGNASTFGPLTISANGNYTQRLGPLMKSYGSTQADLESNGAKFEILRCD